MSTTVEQDLTIEQYRERFPEKMIHIAYEEEDVALCGKALRGPWCDGELVDCVVCAEMLAALRG